ncbi:hypothetical protein Ocin01_09401 [Orchesella cincta]|uniref:Uncharacterized protein n=1 Tax=Orchesella cincta TaxID=48709 RepID=A0A1D2MW54_ORCCI|nr:hypothetical protein Ocin01_09401 [Orchesella cincta]
MNNKVFASFFVLVIIMLIASLTSARPSNQLSLSRQKRQSDQRIAELETLLALQKYGRHRFRMDRKKGVGADGEHPPGYGIIDFHMLGRKKKSTRFSPGELESSLKGVPQPDLLSSYHPEHQLDSMESSAEESVFPVQREHDDKSRQEQDAALPFLYVEKK